MKKVITMMLMLTAVLTASAQGRWETIETEADELKGITGGNVYRYTDDNIGSFIVWDWNDPQMRIVSHDGIFNINSGGWLKILIGIYDAEGKMIEKTDMWLIKEDSRGYTYARTISKGMIPAGQKKKVNKIFKALQFGDGYVRIIAPRYNKTDFDLKIIPYKE